jgi:glycosyltransferase involved in cell wall biosynthesis
MIIFSVIIPHFNDEKRLYRCLQSLFSQDFQKDKIEIIVVDDCSPIDIQKELNLRFPQVRFFRLPENRGPAAARNLGIAEAGGRYLAFVDSDAQVGPQWLNTFEKQFNRGEIIVCGPVFHRNCFLGRITALTAFGNFLDTKDGYKPDCPSVNYAISAATMKDFSYDESLAFINPKMIIQCEDSLLTRQFVSAGLRIRYAVDAWVLHNPRLSIRQVNRRAFLYGIGFSASRSRDSSLPGFWLHKHIKRASGVFLFGIRTTIDLWRIGKHRKVLKINLINLLPTVIYIIWVRIVYAIGVTEGYRK